MSCTILVLRSAKDLLQEEGWTKGAFARDAYGDPVPVMSDRANSFDVSGAIVRVVGEINHQSKGADQAFQQCMNESVPDWQDNATFSEVMACFDETIATLRSRIPDDD